MDNWLIGFRLSYLRAIALAWKEESPGGHPKNTFKERLLKAEDLLTSDDPKISELFGHLPEIQATVRLVENPDKPTEWKPMVTAGWIGLNDSYLIYLPAMPPENDQAMALASYYQLFPTIFGNLNFSDTHYGETTSGNKPITSFSPMLPLDLGVEPGPFLEFGSAILRAIALSWTNDDILKELTETPGDATPVLSRYLGFNNPWNFNIRFKLDERFTWNSEHMCWYNVPKNRIELYYPKRPDDIRYHAIALTEYNNTGPAYPFTCG